MKNFSKSVQLTDLIADIEKILLKFFILFIKLDDLIRPIPIHACRKSDLIKSVPALPKIFPLD